MHKKLLSLKKPHKSSRKIVRAIKKVVALSVVSSKVKRKKRLATAGAFKGTELEKEKFWKEILKIN